MKTMVPADAKRVMVTDDAESGDWGADSDDSRNRNLGDRYSI